MRLGTIILLAIVALAIFYGGKNVFKNGGGSGRSSSGNSGSSGSSGSSDSGGI